MHAERIAHVAADGVVLDFGGTYDGYCVDLTRTLQAGLSLPRFAVCSMQWPR